MLLQCQFQLTEQPWPHGQTQLMKFTTNKMIITQNLNIKCLIDATDALSLKSISLNDMLMIRGGSCMHLPCQIQGKNHMHLPSYTYIPGLLTLNYREEPYDTHLYFWRIIREICTQMHSNRMKTITLAYYALRVNNASTEQLSCPKRIFVCSMLVMLKMYFFWGHATRYLNRNGDLRCDLSCMHTHGSYKDIHTYTWATGVQGVMCT